MRRLLSLLIRILGTLALIGGLAVAFLLLTAGRWFPVYGEPEPADVIVVLSGSYTRPLHAADLYLRGLAPKVLVSRSWRGREERMLDELGVDYPREEEVSLAVLEKRGVPADAVSVFGPGNMSTAQEALELRALFEKEPKRLLVVTSPYHVRRTRYILEDQLQCCALQVVGTPYDPFAEQWWKNRDNARQVLLESVKFLFYILGGRNIADQESP